MSIKLWKKSLDNCFLGVNGFDIKRHLPNFPFMSKVNQIDETFEFQ